MQKTIEAETLSRRSTRFIPISAIRLGSWRPRRTLDSLDKLAASIQAVGLLQPITVRMINNAGYELIAGERRLRACEQNGMSHIDAIVLPAGEADSALLAFAENLQREPLHFLEEAQGYDVLMHEFAFTQPQVFASLGTPDENQLSLLDLPETTCVLVRELGLSQEHAQCLIPLDEISQGDAARRIVEHQLTVQETKAFVQTILKEGPRAHRRMTILMRDHRPYVNALRDLAEQMCRAGLYAVLEEQEEGEYVDVHIRIPKRRWQQCS